MKLVIVAGGKGTRLGLNNIPKPMVPIGGKPLLEYQINLARKYDITNIYILSGYLSDTIVNHFGNGKDFGVNITHIIEKNPLGTAGAVKQIEDKIRERFIVYYGDVALNIDQKSFINFDNMAPSIASIIVHPNDHPYDSDLLDINDENIVTHFYSKPHNGSLYYRNLVNAAVYIFDPKIFQHIPVDVPTDFGKDIFPLLLRHNEKIRAYKSAEYIKDIGTLDRLNKVNEDFVNGKAERFSKRNRRPAIFIDRDGTLVKEFDLLHRAENLELLPCSASAIRKINNSEFLCFLVTNQPVVARNLCDISEVNHIHNKLETLLGEEGTFLNDIYFCPHHPDKGYPEEDPTFKIDCDCRKPKTGMINRAAEEYNADIKSSWIIGDTTVDIQTGINAGMKTILVRTGNAGTDKKYEVYPDFTFDNIEKAVDYILCERAK